MDDPNSKEAIIGNQSFILQFEFNTQNFAETFFSAALTSHLANNFISVLFGITWPEICMLFTFIDDV